MVSNSCDPGQLVQQERLENGEIEKKAEGDEEEEKNEEKEKEDKRDQWSRPIEFTLSCLAMSVGLGNIWRFPFVVYQNGGGAFLIPYFIVLFLIGKPLYYLEMSIGQFASQGCVGVWNAVPAFRGIGYGQLLATTCVASYYVCLVARVVFYLFTSFSSTLPWNQCDLSWDEASCAPSGNTTTRSTETLMAIPEIYYRRSVLNISPNVDDGLGSPEWRLTLCLLFSWALIFCVLVKGVRSSGKAAYFTALFPYLMLFIILGHSVTLEGALDGILFYIRPQWHKLFDPKVWCQAVTQCFFSLSVCFGSIIMFSSYNKFNHPIYRDATIIGITDMLTSFLAGLTIFSISGSTAHAIGKDVSDVISGGETSLAFVLYPQALSTFTHVPQVFAVLFFAMQLTLGVGSAAGPVACIITVICDNFPGWVRWRVTAAVCLAGFMVGLIYVTPGGDYMLVLVDYFGGSFVVLMLAMLEAIALGWIYGVGNICNDIAVMSGTRPNLYWRFSWAVLVPSTLIALFFYHVFNMTPITYRDVKYPTSALVSGWLLAMSAIAPLLICFFIELRKSQKTGTIQKLMSVFRPSSDWGPLRAKDRQRWEQFTNRSSQLRVEMNQFNSSPPNSEMSQVKEQMGSPTRL